MKIVFLNGGLANQVFQYIFYRYAQINAPEEEWYLDDSFFFVHDVHNGYELERVFGLHPNLLSELFDKDVWEYMIRLKKEQNKSIPQILLENGTDIKMINESNNSEEWNPFSGMRIDVDNNSYTPKIIKANGDFYYHGYWLTSEWFHAIEDEMRSELRFPDIDERHNLQYMKEILNSNSASIHVRRGDYITIGICASDDVYLAEIKSILNYVPDITLFVFSDDLEYCKGHTHDMGLDLPQKTIFIEGNRGQESYRDLQLMSMCRHMINGNSSFCYLAALLNQHMEGIVNPAKRKL